MTIGVQDTQQRELCDVSRQLLEGIKTIDQDITNFQTDATLQQNDAESLNNLKFN